jgi:hypothetical protein
VESEMADYEVIRPEQSQIRVGRSYPDLLEMWTQWLVSDNPDSHNYGDVVFIRGADFPENPQQTGYSGKPAMFVGPRSLNICNDQFLFFPVICTIANQVDDHANTAQERANVVWHDNLEGDYPPLANQVLIDGKELYTGKKDESNLEDFNTWTRDFVLHVPDVPYGRSLKDYLDVPISVTGEVPAVNAGPCILFRFRHSEYKSHSLVFQARGVRGQSGIYFSSGVYTINVSPCPSGIQRQDERSQRQLSRTVIQRIRSELEKRKEKKELLEDGEEYKKLQDALTKLESM